MYVLLLDELICLCRRDTPPLWHQLLSFFEACALEVILVRGELLGSWSFPAGRFIGLASFVFLFWLMNWASSRRFGIFHFWGVLAFGLRTEMAKDTLSSSLSHKIMLYVTEKGNATFQTQWNWQKQKIPGINTLFWSSAMYHTSSDRGFCCSIASSRNVLSSTED